MVDCTGCIRMKLAPTERGWCPGIEIDSPYNNSDYCKYREEAERDLKGRKSKDEVEVYVPKE